MLAGEILREPYSHSTASLQGWSFVPAPEDVSFANWVDARAQMAWTPKRPRPQPVVRPWEKPREQRVSMPDPGRSERRNRLRERLGLS